MQVEEVLDTFVVAEATVVALLVALLEESDRLAHHDDAVAQHEQGFVVLSADQTVVFLVDVVAVVLDEVQAVSLLAVVEIRTDVV